MLVPTTIHRYPSVFSLLLAWWCCMLYIDNLEFNLTNTGTFRSYLTLLYPSSVSPIFLLLTSFSFPQNSLCCAFNSIFHDFPLTINLIQAWFLVEVSQFYLKHSSDVLTPRTFCIYFICKSMIYGYIIFDSYVPVYPYFTINFRRHRHTRKLQWPEEQFAPQKDVKSSTILCLLSVCFCIQRWSIWITLRTKRISSCFVNVFVWKWGKSTTFLHKEKSWKSWWKEWKMTMVLFKLIT